MAMIGFQFDTRELRQTIRRIEGMRIALPKIAGEEIVKQINEYADSGRNPDGSKWQKLSPEYAKRKQVLVGNQKANKLLTGGLRKSITVQARNLLIAPDESHIPQAQGLEKLRKSFDVAQPTSDNIERLFVNWWNNIFR